MKSVTARNGGLDLIRATGAGLVFERLEALTGRASLRTALGVEQAARKRRSA